MSNITIRPYTQSDFETVINHMTTLQEYFVGLDQSKEQKSFLTKQEASDYIHQALKDVEEMNGAMYVAEYENELAGFIQGVVVQHQNDVMHHLTHYQHVEGWIGLLFTQPQFRGKGVGRNLINTMKEYFTGQKCSSMRLKVASNNHLAINVYTKYGFEPKDLEMAMKI